ncbi:pentapeptide repeat-containing protein [Rothia dentocariosa]
MPEEREDVEATLEQGTTPDASQQKGKWRAIDWIAGSTLVAEALLSTIWAIAWAFGCRFEHQLQVYLALVLFILTGGYLALIFCPIFRKDNDPRWFHARILSSGIVGGSYAFLLPVVMSLPEGNVNSGGAAAIRQAILLATGGLIALIALGETRRKNDNDREAAENLRIHQQDTLDQQKDQFEKQLEKQQEQFEANAFKDRKAERRERYTKAVEQLGDEKAPVRMGGVYTLVGLVDEWLEEESIRKYEDRLKEGQVIINNLCAYIRSPFTLASHYDELMQDTPDAEGVYQDKVQEFYADKATLDSETDVRLSIIKEIHDRIQGPDKNTPGAWSDFEYDFSGSTFFYPIDLTNSYYAKPINFTGSTYQGWADFTDSTYKALAYFGGSTYQAWAYFSRSTYQDVADFSRSTYQGWAYFSRSTYQDVADFGGSTYQGWADFSRSTYQWANFSDSTYENETDFSGSIFYQETYFGEDGYSNSSSCFTNHAPQFYDKKKRKNTLFGSPNNDFTVDIDKGYPIDLDSKGIPLNCKFLTSEQKEFLKGEIQEIEETNNKLLEVKDPKEKAELLKKLQSFDDKLHKWREEVTTVKVEDVVAEDTES